MAATSSYQAGVETSNSSLAFGVETTWGTAPGGNLTAIRYTGDTLAMTRTRQRPSEINTTREAAQAVTTQVAAGGTINIALSFGTYDQFFSSCLQSDGTGGAGGWQALQTINSTLADITITAGPPIVITSTTSGKFANIAAGQWIRILGCTNTANNAFWYVTTKTSAVNITVTGPGTPVTETSDAGNIKIRSSTIKNGTTFQSMYLQQKFASNLFKLYGGAYPSRIVLNGGLGNFMSGTIDVVAKSEASATSGTAVDAAPTGRVIDPIAGFVGIYWNETALSGGTDRFTITMENTGAASEFAMGSSSAQGILTGTFQCSATFRTYFKGFTEYTLFLNETAGRLAYIMKDADGDAYAFTLPSAVLGACRILAGGPSQPVYAEFDVEAGPQSGGGSLIIDRLKAT